MPSIKCPQRNILCSTLVCTCHFALLSKQNWITPFSFDCHFQFFLFFFSLNTTCHLTAKQMTCSWGQRVPVSWLLVSKWNERSVLGDSLGVEAITITLTPPTPLSLILLSAVRLNGQKSQDRLIHRARRSDVKSPSPPYTVTTVTLPSILLHTLPSPRAAEVTGHKSLQTWAWGGFGGWVEEAGRVMRMVEAGWGGCNTNLKEISPHA